MVSGVCNVCYRVSGICGFNGKGEEEVLVSRGWVQVRYWWLFCLLVKDNGGGGSDCEGLTRFDWSTVLVYGVAFFVAILMLSV
jgi:hypothetical protein